MKRLALVALAVIFVSACTAARPGSFLAKVKEDVERTNVDAREDLPVVFGMIYELPGLRLNGITYRKEPPYSLEARLTPHKVTLDYGTATVSITTFYPLERQKFVQPTGSMEVMGTTSIVYGDDWCQWFNGSDLYEVSAEDPLRMASLVLASRQRIDPKNYKFLGFYNSLPIPDKETNLIEIMIESHGEDRFTQGTYTKADEDSTVQISIAKGRDFPPLDNPRPKILGGREFLSGYTDGKYALVRNGYPVSVIVETDSMFAVANGPQMERLAADVVARIIANVTAE